MLNKKRFPLDIGSKLFSFPFFESMSLQSLQEDVHINKSEWICSAGTGRTCQEHEIILWTVPRVWNETVRIRRVRGINLCIFFTLQGFCLPTQIIACKRWNTLLGLYRLRLTVKGHFHYHLGAEELKRGFNFSFYIFQYYAKGGGLSMPWMLAYGCHSKNALVMTAILEGLCMWHQ